MFQKYILIPCLNICFQETEHLVPTFIVFNVSQETLSSFKKIFFSISLYPYYHTWLCVYYVS